MRDFFEDVVFVVTDRLLIVSVIFSILAFTLLSRLYDMQIINGDNYIAQSARETDSVTLPIKAARGEIYDRLGRPLAVNETVYTIKLNPSAQFDYKRLNENLFNLITLFEQNGETYIDEFPMSKDEPYSLNFYGSDVLEAMWRRDMGIKSETPSEIFSELREKFDIDSDYTNDDARKIISLRSAIYMKRYRRFSPITLAAGASEKTMAAIEEDGDKFAGITAEPDFARVYPGGVAFSHMIGYVGKINADDIAEYEALGYTQDDIVGKAGLEQAYETGLKGAAGSVEAVTDAITGQILSKSNETVSPKPGDRYFLTVDASLQQAAYAVLESALKEILVNSLSGTGEIPLTARDVIANMFLSGCVNIKTLWAQSIGSYSYRLKHYCLSQNEESECATGAGAAKIREILARGVSDKEIDLGYCLIAMAECGVFSMSEETLSLLINGVLTPAAFLTEKLLNGEITPQMTNSDPCTGSVVMIDIKTGGVLAAASYPSYDNNEMVNNFSQYFSKINNDATSPAFYRAFRERRAPGSTFKMITAVTGLEFGSITPQTLIHDDTTFMKAGVPYLKCWSSVSHGDINIAQALTVSCNYFFCETAYRLGNAKDGNPQDSINALNKYMTAFGLNERTGVEIGEAYDARRADAFTQAQISSPEYKEYLDRFINKNVRSQWFDGDTVATAIGQSKNNYTTANMAKYTAALAAGGARYKLHFTDYKEDYYGKNKEKYAPVLEEVVPMSDSTIGAVYEGMYNAINTPQGTGSVIFTDFNFKIAGKTGTAQEDAKRNDHTSFAGFAPYDDPSVAIYVCIPFGNTTATPYAAAAVAKSCLEAYLNGEQTYERITQPQALVR